MDQGPQNQPASKQDLNNLKSDLKTIIRQSTEELSQVIAQFATQVGQDFQEVKGNIKELQNGQVRIENKLDATVEHVADHEVRITSLEKAW